MRITELINRPTVIKQCSIKFLLDTQSVSACAKVFLRLSPKPRVVVEYDLPSDEVAASNEIRSKRTVDVQLEQGPEVNMLVGDYLQIGGGKISGILIPVEQPVTVINDGVEINRCKFTLINFPSIWGQQDIHYTKKVGDKTGSFVTQHLKLYADPWLVEITGVDSVMGIHHRLTLEGGSAITHFGNITRCDGNDFRSDELKQFLEALHLFLSFARGSYCGLALLSGNDRNRKRVWQQWGTYKAEPWHGELPTWVCGLQSESLSSVFKGFWSRFTDVDWNQTISRTTNWHLRSNESGESEVSIILTQAALEHLTFRVVGKKSVGIKEGDWIASALNKMGIDTNMPPQCKELSRLQSHLKWYHGPHALVDLRNNLIHADNRLGSVPSEAHSEAWNLGQWYVELMLLKLCGYTGQYRNRLKYGQGYSSEVEDVP